MEGMNFTKGPWAYHPTPNGCSIKCGTERIAEIEGNYPQDMQEANAKLIAASPELLNELMNSNIQLLLALELLFRMEETEEVKKLIASIEIQALANREILDKVK